MAGEFIYQPHASTPEAVVVAKGRPEGQLLDLFQAQREEDTCLPTSVKSIHDELCDRKGIAGRVSYSFISGATNYRRGFASTRHGEELRRALDPRLKRFGQSAHWESGTRADTELLKRILSDPSGSFPLVGLNPEWWGEPNLRAAPRGVPTFNHAAILVDLGDDEVVIYDPMQRFLYGDADGKAFIINVPLVRFQKYWENDTPPRWTFWMSMLGKTTKPRTISDFEER